MNKKVILCILDGWGIAPPNQYNGIIAAKYWPKILENYPHTTLEASEEFVGLPHEQMGNSEVGHMTIGLGRVIYQDLPKIDDAFKSDLIPKNPKVQEACRILRSTKTACHVMGLLSSGGVHSHINHIIQAALLLTKEEIPVHIHAFLDGRDTPPKSALNYVEKFLNATHDQPLIKLSSLSGRYYAMDRDNRWKRTQKAYEAIVTADAPTYKNPMLAIQESYDQGITDEFIKPHIYQDYKGVMNEDGIWMINFRSDRVRQLLKSFLIPDFQDFSKKSSVIFGPRLAMNEYADYLTPFIPSIFNKDPINNSLGEIVSKAGLKQLRVAETEKYAHVTFFFNGGAESPFSGEERILINSPHVATYDLKPEMSAPQVLQAVCNNMQRNDLNFIVVNFANADMVGHTGVVDSIYKAIQCLDNCIKTLEEECLKTGWTFIITADHGNAECMKESNGSTHTAHTCNPVPFVVINGSNIKLKPGTLADIAPTILEILKLPKPSEMKGISLIKT